MTIVTHKQMVQTAKYTMRIYRFWAERITNRLKKNDARFVFNIFNFILYTSVPCNKKTFSKYK